MAPCPLLSSFVLLCLFPLRAVSAAPECHRQRTGKQVSPLFIFGDSFFDSGNNNYINTTTLDQANFSPYGETHFHFPTGRFSDGRLISDFIAEYANLPEIPPYLQPDVDVRRYYKIGVNFASAGAGALVETFQGSVISLKTQLMYHKRVETWLRKETNHAEAKNTLSNTVYLFSIGTNDYISPFLISNSTLFNSSYSHSQYVGMVVGNLTSAIKEIHRRGGRKFGFLNLGPLGCLPGLRILLSEPNNGSWCIQDASLLANLHNKALLVSLRRLEHQLEGFKYSLYDFSSNLRHRMNRPFKFGFREGKTACCGTGRFRGTFSCGGKRPVREFQVCENPKEYVFWDSYHLTEKVYNEMALQMWNGETVKGSYNLETLFRLSNFSPSRVHGC